MHSKSTVVILKFMKSRHSGFTLVELLITVAVAAVLASLAVPSFRTLLLKRSVQSAADTLVSDMRFARAEALKRSARVTICASSNGTSCAGAGGQWSSGWMVFVPSAANGNFTAGDEIVRVQDALPSIASIADAGGPLCRNSFMSRRGGLKLQLKLSLSHRPVACLLAWCA